MINCIYFKKFVKCAVIFSYATRCTVAYKDWEALYKAFNFGRLLYKLKMNYITIKFKCPIKFNMVYKNSVKHCFKIIQRHT